MTGSVALKEKVALVATPARARRERERADASSCVDRTEITPEKSSWGSGSSPREKYGSAPRRAMETPLEASAWGISARAS